MLQKSAVLNPKAVRGRKLRATSHCRPILFVLLFFVAASAFCLVLAHIMGARGESFRQVGFSLLIPVLVFALILDSGLNAEPLVCILGQDRIWFDSSEIVELTRGGACRVRSFSSGSVAYTDVRSVKYFPRGSRLLRSCILLAGAEFEVCLSGGSKTQARRLEKRCTKQNPFFGASVPDFTRLEHERQGLFLELWTLFESDAYRAYLEPSVTIRDIDRCEEDNTIYLTLQTQDPQFHEFELCFEEDIVYVDGEYGLGEEIQYAELANVEAVFAWVNALILKNR